MTFSYAFTLFGFNMTFNLIAFVIFSALTIPGYVYSRQVSAWAFDAAMACKNKMVPGAIYLALIAGVVAAYIFFPVENILISLVFIPFIKENNRRATQGISDAVEARMVREYAAKDASSATAAFNFINKL